MIDKILLVMGFSAALMLAILTHLTLRPKTARKFTAWSALTTGIIGLLLYGYGYSSVGLPVPLAVVRSTISVFGMFLGNNEINNISSAPLFQSDWGQVLFWLVHLFALYSSAGAAIGALGSGALERIRLWLSRRGDLLLIYGVTEGSVSFAKQMQDKNTSIVFIDDSPSPELLKPIQNMGCLVRTDAGATQAHRDFLQAIGIRPGQRQIWVYCLDQDQNKNLRFAGLFQKSAQALQISKDQLHLTILSQDEAVYASLLASEQNFGYWDVNILNEAQMVSRLLILQNPPCDQIVFNSEGVAQNDLDCLLIGFGRIGQAVLDQLLCHGQFFGSKFHATIFALDCQQVQGRLETENSMLLKNYDLRSYSCDARSKDMYNYLREHKDSLNYIVIAAGSDKKNEELSRELMHHLTHLNKKISIYLCGYQGVTEIKSGELPVFTPLYCKEVLWSNTLDRKAMLLNHCYCGDNGKTKEENWDECSYFNRLSSRASADFAPAFLRMSHATEEDVRNGQWNPQGALLENMSITEHLRWCAFHYTMGFCPMSLKDHEDRCRKRKEELEAKGNSSYKTTKDMVKHQHVCLVPWEELDKISQQENEILKTATDYKMMDQQNVLMLPEILAE